MKPETRDKIIVWSILLAAFLFRFAGLSLKPPHADEGVNGFFVNQIWANGFFAYDPTNYHGPLLFYLLQISEKVFGFGIHSFRIATALFSLLTVWLVMRSRDILGEKTAFFSALVIGLSPGMVFFGRSAIHEAVFVFFQVLWIIGFLKMREQDVRKGTIWFSSGILGTLLLKETFVIHVLSFFMAWAWADASARVFGHAGKKDGILDRLRTEKQDALFFFRITFIVALVWLAFFSGFFHNRKGVSDFFVALMPWLKTGVGGSGHDKPFYYWLGLMMRYEWAGLAGLAGASAGMFSRSWKLRFFSMLGLGAWLIYSLIPYKTPWCIISILWPFFFVVGFWFEELSTRYRSSAPIFGTVMTLAAVFACHSALSGYQLNFRHYADPLERYVYVQTKNDIKALNAVIESKINESPHFRNMVIQVRLNDLWPLPWSFSRYPRLEYGNYQEPLQPGPDVILAEVSADDRGLAGAYMRRQAELRDARGPLSIYLKKTTFEKADLTGYAPVRGLQSEGL